jgi:hypothetical protein
MDQDAVRQMLDKDRAEWSLLVAVLDAHGDEALHTSGAPWTNRDIYAHLSRWLEHSNNDMKTYCAGGSDSPPVDNADEINFYWQQHDAELTLAEARLKALEAFEKRLEIVASVSPDQWDAELDRIAMYDGWKHYSMHRRYIQLP